MGSRCAKIVSAARNPPQTQLAELTALIRPKYGKGKYKSSMANVYFSKRKIWSTDSQKNY